VTFAHCRYLPFLLCKQFVAAKATGVALMSAATSQAESGAFGRRLLQASAFDSVGGYVAARW